MINLDGFALSHITQQLEEVSAGDFIPPLVLDHRIDTENPGGYGCMTSSVDYVRIRYDIERSIRESMDVIRETEAEFAKRFGRSYSWTDNYQCEDAEVLIVSMGTLGKEAEVAIDILRKEGIKAGAMRVRWLRPFPDLDFGDRELVVIDRNYSFGFGGILAGSIRAKTGKECYNVIAGLGGQEVTYNDIASFVRNRKIGTEEWFGVEA
jgi:pyruvate ferredoxin oxidoreductase alpha subunit